MRLESAEEAIALNDVKTENYWLVETDVSEGYAIAKDITFKINMDGTLQRVVMEDKKTAGKGQVIVQKLVMQDDEYIAVDYTFYFALFTDAALTNMADAGIAELRLNNASEGTVVFSDLPLGSYYLAETDEDGVPVGSAFEYVVTIDSSYCKLDEANTSIERTIVNTVKEEEEVPTVTPTPSPTPGTPYYPNGGSGNPSSPIYDSTTSVTPVKTGDDTPVLPYAAGAFASLLAAMWAAVLAMKRRKRNNG